MKHFSRYEQYMAIILYNYFIFKRINAYFRHAKEIIEFENNFKNKLAKWMRVYPKIRMKMQTTYR